MIGRTLRMIGRTPSPPPSSVGSKLCVRPLVTSNRNRYPEVMGEHIERPGTEELSRIARKRPVKPTTEAIGRRLLEIMVYRMRCRIGGKLTLDDLAESEVGDWKMPDFRTACAYAASQGWLIVRDDTLTLTTAGLRAV